MRIAGYLMLKECHMRSILIFVIILGAMLQLRIGLHGPDSVNYYNIAKSISFEWNLMLNNEFEEVAYLVTISRTYHVIEQHQIGVSLIWMFILDFLKSIGIAREPFLTAAINLSEYLLGVLALILIFQISIKFFSRTASFLSILAVLFGTNLFAYIVPLSGSAHVSSIFFISCFLWFYFNTYKERAKTNWLILGGLAGMMTMTRGDAALYLIFPIFDLAKYIKDRKLELTLICSFVFILGFLFTFSPQLLFWKIVFGKIFMPVAEYGYFTGNNFLEVLFSSSRGFLFYSPLIGLCFFLGLYYLYKKDKILTFSSVIIFISLVYWIGSAKYNWEGGWSFGHRFFLVFIPLLILSVAAYFERLSLKKQIMITVISSVWSFLLFMLFIFKKELYSYKSLLYELNFDFFYEATRFIHNLAKIIIIKSFFLKSLFLAIIFFSIFLLWKLCKEISISKMFKKKIFIFLVSVIILYIDGIIIQCYFNDIKEIARLKEKGFYENAVFGDFDRVDLAESYFEFADNELRARRIGSAIEAIIKAMRMYPPYQEEGLQRLRSVYTDFPQEFKQEIQDFTVKRP